MDTRSRTDQVEYIILSAEERTNVRLSLIGDLPMWEASPGWLHQEEVDRIRASIEPRTDAAGECGCFHGADVLIRFPDGSLMQPDVSIFCQRPERKYGATSRLPDAVVEVISPGSEAKDLRVAPPFYLGHGIKDVIVFDPRDLSVVHFRQSGERRGQSPLAIDLECGGRCVV